MSKTPFNARGITELGLQRSLASLSAEPEQAGALYLQLQGKLIRYFAWNRCPQPETCADEVLDRVARRLDAGEQLDHPLSYIHAVAHRVLLEAKRKERFAGLPIHEGIAPPPALGHDEATLACLDHCLQALPPESRALLLEYYTPPNGNRGLARQQIADRMGIDVNALRNRVLRLRRNLERCIENSRAGYVNLEKDEELE